MRFISYFATIAGVSLIVGCSAATDKPDTDPMDIASNPALTSNTFLALDDRLVATNPGTLSTGDGSPGVSYLKIKCTSRGSDGRCNQATCEREDDPNQPGGKEITTCASFSLRCEAHDHVATGDGRNNATCTRKVSNA